MQTTLRRLNRNVQGQSVTADKLFAGAFADDPAFTQLFPRASTRPATVHSLMHSTLGAAFERGVVFGAFLGEQLLGVSAGWPIGKGLHKKHSVFDFANLARFIPFAWHVTRHCPTRWPAVLSNLAAVEEGHRGCGAFWYGAGVAVRANVRGRGIGNALITAVINQAANDHLELRVETSDSKLVPVFERLGLRVDKKIPAFRHGPPMWVMCRSAAEGLLHQEPTVPVNVPDTPKIFM